MNAAEVERYVDAATARGGLRGAINYYRAAGLGLWPANLPRWVPSALLAAMRALRGVRAGDGELGARQVQSSIVCSVLVVWGRRDRYLGEELAAPDPALVPDVTLRYLDATHWDLGALGLARGGDGPLG